MVAAALSFALPPKNNKKGAGRKAKKDKDPVNKSGARPKRRRGPKAEFGISSITWSYLTKQHTTYSVRKFPSISL